MMLYNKMLSLFIYIRQPFYEPQCYWDIKNIKREKVAEVGNFMPFLMFNRKNKKITNYLT